MKEKSRFKTKHSTLNRMSAIILTGVSKKYTIHHEKPTFVEHIIKGSHEEFWALKDVNLEIRKGERVGLIGPNGSGKTTLLKIIAGISTPTSGRVDTHGKIVSLIDLRAGFHPDLTGIENIFLNGMILGLSKGEINKKLTSIISFADIGPFIDAPLFTYSSGMTLRLGFAIAIFSNPRIILLDEALSVGDQDFQKKSQREISRLSKQYLTVIFVSHNLQEIYNSCERIITLNKGKIIGDAMRKNFVI